MILTAEQQTALKACQMPDTILDQRVKIILSIPAIVSVCMIALLAVFF
jgi:hypothetical protein